jgi:hypothetical protein
VADAEAGIPPEVERLIARALPSMVHIELLLLLHRTAPAAWSVQSATSELKGTAALVEGAFVDLERTGFAAAVAGARPPQWRLDASSDTNLAATMQLRDMYDRRPVTLVNALYNRPPSPEQAFADAFRLRPKGER